MQGFELREIPGFSLRSNLISSGTRGGYLGVVMKCEMLSCHEFSVYSRSVWKATYLRRCRVAANWRRLPIGGSMVLRGHEEHVITCLQIQDDMLVTGSDDNTLRVWSIEQGKVSHSHI
ncbi:unnamed protein product [Heligmosomoides polygyrus]|uniref:WD_REPEATS_REGION domain-containing protein n=1 Tax=Heligmosomoides polygyrus TaxID=6339 RepID=A0A183FA58_HELPZ|nr:unnamed protein product [Heligmosomoides polygyrus]